MAALTFGPRDIRGVWATVLLDVDAAGRLRLDAIDEQIERLSETGVDGVYCNGTASEFHLQSEAEFAEVASRTVNAARGRGLPVQVGAAHPLPRPALDRVATARRFMPDAIQVILPDWTPMRAIETLRFLEACAEAADGIPLVLYNPPHAKTVLPPDTLCELAGNLPTLVGLKCGGGDADWYASMRPVMERLSVFIPGHHYASGTRQGAHGSYSNMSCLNPGAAVAWARQARDNPDAALVLEERIASFMSRAIAPLLQAGIPGFVIDKAMAVAGGWAPLGARMMWPVEQVPAPQIASIRAAMAETLPEFLHL
ncbi:dihydrodipicolinate synthase family protein [Nitratireductor soli]|uniref:dihydrodipicolinate synthase family protein n=1 Tax=Nitratireductor soli TaxID=1670619 RepID=UPI00065E54A2|nr:dihydrodipicolinate synthase family protein [Nitratireductor soli]